MNKVFTQTAKKSSKIELESLIEQTVDNIYIDRIANLTASLKGQLGLDIVEMKKLEESLGDKAFDAKRPREKVIETIKKLFPKKEDRRIPYKYMNMVVRVTQLKSVMTSKVKLRSVAKKTLEGLVRAEVSVKKGRKVTISQLINTCNLKPGGLVTGTFSRRAFTEDNEDAFIIDGLKLQFISELCELDLIDMTVSDHTHMVEIPTIIAKGVDLATANRMHRLAELVNTKTIFLEPVQFDYKDIITKSSWYYRTPDLCEDLIEFVNIQHSTKYEFVSNAEELVEDAYKEHLSDDKGNLPEGWESWVPKKIEFLKEQIRASIENGGHYIQGSGDSVWRWYMQAEIGHFQTSKSLRKLVKVSGMNNPIKKDFRNNVIQVYSLLTKVNMGHTVGLVEESERQDDLRKQIANALNLALETDVFTKDNIKPLFMVWAYNAGKNRILDGVKVTEAQMFGLDKINVKVEGLMDITGAANNTKNRDLIWNTFESVVTELVPTVVILKKLFKQIIKHNPLTETSWTTPDGGIAQYASAESLSEVLYWTDSTGKMHQHTHHKKLIVENVKSAGLLPRVIHSFDAWIMRQIVLRLARLGITVIPNHDSFMFDEQHEAEFDRIVLEVFSELLESNAFGNVIGELNKANKPLTVRDSSGKAISDEVLYDNFGRLTLEDLEYADPTDLEEI